MNDKELKQILTDLSPQGRAAFAYAVARRVTPIYRAHFGDDPAVEEALERLRVFIRGFGKASDGAREVVQKMTGYLAPEREDPVDQAATQAAVAIASALETTFLDSVKGAESARSFALDAVAIVSPEHVEDERRRQNQLLEVVAEQDPDFELDALENGGKPPWLDSVSPRGPLLG